MALPEHPTGVVQQLIAQSDQVGYDRRPGRAFLRWVSRGRLGQDRDWPQTPALGTPWRDAISVERGGGAWRQRTAHLDDEEVFGVDYQICRRCGLGWVEQPATDPDYQRHGLASAGLAALRRDHPGLAWHTAGGHSAAREFWAAVGTDVPGGYQQRDACPHVELSA